MTDFTEVLLSVNCQYVIRNIVDNIIKNNINYKWNLHNINLSIDFNWTATTMFCNVKNLVPI